MIWNIWYESDDVTYSAQYMYSLIHNRFFKKSIVTSLIRIVIVQSLQIGLLLCILRVAITVYKTWHEYTQTQNPLRTLFWQFHMTGRTGFCFCQHGFLSSSSGWRFNSKEQNKQVFRALYLSALVASNFRKCNIRTVKLMLIVIYELYQNSLQNVNFKSFLYSSGFFSYMCLFLNICVPPPQKK